MNVVLAGGGTAGHTSPLIATAEVLAERGASCTCIGTPRGLETKVIPAAGLELDVIDPVPMPRRPGVDLAKVPWRLTRAVRQARAVLKQRRADVVVGFGGYVSMPAYVAARTLGVPVVIHEQNALPGLANKAAARFARHVAVSFPGTPLPKADFLGLPVRRAIADLAASGRAARREQARREFGLDLDRPTVLVSGGSSGARAINDAVLACRDDLLAAGVQILHVWGLKNFTDDLTEVRADNGAGYFPVAYVDAMETAYAAADVMIGRSGAGTVVETAVLGLPTIYIPFPHGNGEQALNATPVVDAGAGVLLPESELSADRLLREVTGIITDPQRLAAMQAAGPALMPHDAATRLAQAVLAAAKGNDHGLA